MTRYIVKVTNVAKDTNPNFAGEISIHYYGVNDVHIAHEGSHADSIHTRRNITDWMVKEYGYKRHCDALRNSTYKYYKNDAEHSCATKYWNCEAEIIEMDV